jgi:hypothetical protein
MKEIEDSNKEILDVFNFSIELFQFEDELLKLLMIRREQWQQQQ